MEQQERSIVESKHVLRASGLHTATIRVQRLHARERRRLAKEGPVERQGLSCTPWRSFYRATLRACRFPACFCSIDGAHLRPSFPEATMWLQVRTFKAEFPKYEKILPRRNWAEVCVSPPGGSTALGTNSADELVFTFRIEATVGMGENSIRAIPVPIPILSGGGELVPLVGSKMIFLLDLMDWHILESCPGMWLFFECASVLQPVNLMFAACCQDDSVQIASISGLMSWCRCSVHALTICRHAGSLASAMGGMRISDSTPNASPTGPFAWKPSLSNLTNTLKPLASFGRTNSGSTGQPTAYTGVPANPSNYQGPDNVGYPKYNPGEQPSSGGYQGGGSQGSYPNPAVCVPPVAGQQYSSALPSGQQHPMGSNPSSGGSGPYPSPNNGSSSNTHNGSGGTGGDAYPRTGGSQNPGSSSAYPGSGSQNPSSGSAYAGSGSQNTSGGSAYPGSSSQNTGSGSAYPGSGSQNSSSGSAYPGSGSQNPGSGSSQNPSGGSAYPGSGGQNPSAGSAYPSSGSSQQPAMDSYGSGQYTQNQPSSPQPARCADGNSIQACYRVVPFNACLQAEHEQRLEQHDASAVCCLFVLHADLQASPPRDGLAVLPCMLTALRCILGVKHIESACVRNRLCCGVPAGRALGSTVAVQGGRTGCSTPTLLRKDPAALQVQNV
ncbi:hypothetical protein MMC29_003588 [Sticta canariensis]|nr:hypothetical protein [Sticta canariensis]